MAKKAKALSPSQEAFETPTKLLDRRAYRDGKVKVRTKKK